MRDFDQRVETTYADLRPTDLVIDKAGNAWPIADLGSTAPGPVPFWLCDPVTKVKMHRMVKESTDPVTVSRVPTHADDAAKLEADFPKSLALDEFDSAAQTAKGAESVESELRAAKVDEVDMADAVRGVEQLLGGTVEAEVTAEEVDAVRAATEEAPVQLPEFDTMTPLEMRSHLYLLHGVYAQDMRSRDETIAMHARAHQGQQDGSLQSAYVPHVHSYDAVAEVK